MSRYQEALDKIKNMGDKDLFNEFHIEWADTLQKLIVEHQQLKEENQKLKGKETPKKLKNKTDKDGRLLLVCPTCGDVYMKFWSDVETVSCRKYCDECGQKLDWSEE